MVRRILFPAFLILAAGCSKAPTGSSIDEIGAAYALAVTDGQQLLHLAPHVHPDLQARLAEAPMLGNRVPSSPQTLDSRALRPVTAAELAELAPFFEFPVAPTHVLEFTVTQRPDAKTTITRREPLHLRAEGAGYFVVFGLLRSTPAAPAAPPAEGYTFAERDGLWRHLWELRAATGATAAHRLEVREAGTDRIIAVLLTAEQVRPVLAAGDAVIFRLWSKGAAAPHDPSAVGGSNVPFAYQAGRQAGSDLFSVREVQLTGYEPVRQPVFADNRMALAAFAGEIDGARRTYVVEWVREEDAPGRNF
ncbi:MAG TPA: hypothetical protein PLF88_06410 [Opitutaceae bacterium]|nr:hypothetical protein [Opitutaceae bacterium]HRJ48094.1 hypothetical protein [Opitutaceae bacterium]